jgi:hypothetical protein
MIRLWPGPFDTRCVEIARQCKRLCTLFARKPFIQRREKKTQQDGRARVQYRGPFQIQNFEMGQNNCKFENKDTSENISFFSALSTTTTPRAEADAEMDRLDLTPSLIRCEGYPFFGRHSSSLSTRVGRNGGPAVPLQPRANVAAC